MFLNPSNFTVSSLKCLKKGFKNAVFPKKAPSGQMFGYWRLSQPCGLRPIYKPPPQDFFAGSTPVAGPFLFGAHGPKSCREGFQVSRSKIRLIAFHFAFLYTIENSYIRHQ